MLKYLPDRSLQFFYRRKNGLGVSLGFHHLPLDLCKKIVCYCSLKLLLTVKECKLESHVISLQTFLSSMVLIRSSEEKAILVSEHFYDKSYKVSRLQKKISLVDCR